jgi:PAS domain S-box-containing protein
VIAFSDISEQDRMEVALRESETEYRTILATALDGFWMTNMEQRMIEVNDAYCVMSGYRREELLNMQISDLEAMESTEEIVRHTEKLLTQGYDRFESYHRRKNGTIFPVEISAQHLTLRGGVMVVFVRDITERHRTLERLRILFNESNDAMFFHPLTSGYHRTQPDWSAFPGRRALVADDLESSMRQLLTGILSSWGMETLAVSNGRQAVDTLLRQGPFDLVILDWKRK